MRKSLIALCVAGALVAPMIAQADANLLMAQPALFFQFEVDQAQPVTLIDEVPATDNRQAVMLSPVESIKLGLFVAGLVLLSLSFVAYSYVSWRLAPACIIGGLLCWINAHLIYWFDQVFDPGHDYCDPCSGYSV